MFIIYNKKDREYLTRKTKLGFYQSWSDKPAKRFLTEKEAIHWVSCKGLIENIYDKYEIKEV